MRLQIGDSIGMVQKVFSDANGRENYWRLVSDTINKIAITKSGTKYYAKKFHPLDADDVDDNTEILENNDSIMLVHEVFGLTDTLKKRCERWIEWANNNPDKAVSVLNS